MPLTILCARPLGALTRAQLLLRDRQLDAQRIHQHLTAVQQVDRDFPIITGAAALPPDQVQQMPGGIEATKRAGVPLAVILPILLLHDLADRLRGLTQDRIKAAAQTPHDLPIDDKRRAHHHHFLSGQETPDDEHGSGARAPTAPRPASGRIPLAAAPKYSFGVTGRAGATNTRPATDFRFQERLARTSKNLNSLRTVRPGGDSDADARSPPPPARPAPTVRGSWRQHQKTGPASSRSLTAHAACCARCSSSTPAQARPASRASRAPAPAVVRPVSVLWSAHWRSWLPPRPAWSSPLPPSPCSPPFVAGRYPASRMLKSSLTCRSPFRSRPTGADRSNVLPRSEQKRKSLLDQPHRTDSSFPPSRAIRSAATKRSARA